MSNKDPVQAQLDKVTAAQKERKQALEGAIRTSLRSDAAKAFIQWLEANADAPSYAVGMGTTPTDVAFFEGRRDIASTILKHAKLR